MGKPHPVLLGPGSTATTTCGVKNSWHTDMVRYRRHLLQILFFLFENYLLRILRGHAEGIEENDL